MRQSVGFLVASLAVVGQVKSLHINSLIDRASESCDWSYVNTTAWADDCAGCDGSSQSPIDLPDNPADMNTTAGYELNYAPDYFKPLKGKWARKGYTIQFTLDDWEEGPQEMSYTKFGAGTSFQLWQLHFHWGENNNEGSEHTVDGQKYPLEVHFVHVNADYANNLTQALTEPDGLLVIGFLFYNTNDFELFKDARRFSPVRRAAEKINHHEIEMGMADVEIPGEFRHHHWFEQADNVAGHWHYEGGLTTPNCNEVVTWIINGGFPLLVSHYDLSKLREMQKDGEEIHKNFRDPQPLNGRTVWYTYGN